MGERAQYHAGTFSWTDLTTPDQPAAKGFYEALFGWEAEDMPAGEGVVYSMMRLDGQYVAAISPQPEQQREAGVPPMWNSYLTVESADAALERARALGADVHSPAFDVFEAGRMGVVQDPQGAYFEVWQPRRHIGAGVVNRAGALTWNELYTDDVEASAGFYAEMFGWTYEDLEAAPMPYRVIKRPDGGSNGGITTMQGMPTSWLVYFGVDDVAASLAKVEELGGRTVVGSMSVGPGQIALVTDAQGARFGLYAGHFDD